MGAHRLHPLRPQPESTPQGHRRRLKVRAGAEQGCISSSTTTTNAEASSGCDDVRQRFLQYFLQQVGDAFIAAQGFVHIVHLLS